MDLPTYTNIWRIEKRLYKLYDLRLPMPLPLVQIGVFAGVFVPWILLLRFTGIPFKSPWHVLYIVPPGVLTWLATRPVIEGKRLTELLLSQGRYLAEPRTWCRLTPIREPREVVVVARVWRRRDAPAPVAAPERAAIKSRRRARKARPAVQEVPVASVSPAVMPRPAVAGAPQPLAEYAAQREATTAPTTATAPASVPAPQPPVAPLAPPAPQVPAVPRASTAPQAPVASTPAGPAEPAPAAPKPWRRSTRDIFHEEDVRLETAAELERPPATPQLEIPPATSPSSGKRGLASGVRRPGAAEEFWKAIAPPTRRQSPMVPSNEGIPGQPVPPFAAGPAEPTPRRRLPQQPAPEETAQEPSGGEPGDRKVAGQRTRATSPSRPPVTEPRSSSGEVAGTRPPEGAPQQPAPAEQAPAATREDIPQQPAVPATRGGAPAPQGPSDSGGEQGTEAPSGVPGVPPEDALRPTASTVGDGAAQASPQEAPESREEQAGEPAEGVPGATREDIPQRPRVPAPREETAAAASAREDAPGEETPRKPERPADTRPDIPGVPAPTRPDIPMVPGAFGAHAGREAPAEPPRLEPPKPWSQGLSKPLRPATTDAMVWPPVPEPGAREPFPPQPQAPPPQAPRSPQPRAPRPPEPPIVPDEQPPPREVRSGPASPVRPRPLPPPPAPPPSGPAITPPDPEHEVSTGGLRRLIQAVGGGHGDVDAEYQMRLQQPFQGTRHIVMLGCTGGAGQTVTALMLGHTFAQHNGEPVVAIDVNPGPGALARRTRSETNETLTSLITRADQVGSLTAMRRYTSQAKSGLDVIAAGKNPLQALDDRDYALAIRTIDRFYSVTLLDAAAAVVARVLPYADQIVLVAPASADAPRAVAMTFEWLDGHGYEELRSRAVTVINGVSRRSLDDVEQAEAVARGRCRALVRIPWDDHLSMDRAPRNELKSLRAPTRRAYLALAGVVAGGFTVVPERYQELAQEQEATR